ncbi:MAG TPA: NUDIX domain-containing protein [Candidatus Paceibacterota bacterium]
MQLGGLTSFVSRLHQQRKYRPTIFAVIQNSDGLFGVGIQNNPERNYGLVQGRIELNEEPEAAAFREAEEEAGILRENVSTFMPHLCIGTQSGSRDPAFSTGKLYLGSFMRLKPGVDVCIVPSARTPPSDGAQEILEWWWKPAEEVCRLLVEQPGVANATAATREKGQNIFCPAIRDAVELQQHIDLLEKLG